MSKAGTISMSSPVSPNQELTPTIPLSEGPAISPTGPFVTSLPGTVGADVHDQWLVVTEHLREKETERCEVWKDEVQSILVFAGLFSAVVTGLLVDSYKSLQDDPSELLLSSIVVQLAYLANNSAGITASPPDPAKPVRTFPLTSDSPNKVVNTLWFLSLVLSLTAALVGLVALQWLREHLRPSARNVSLKSLPALLHMQSESLDAFYVPQVFTTLPLLLILAIVLFLIGLVEYLWNLNHTVAIPVIIAISLTLAFIVYTTVRPGLQGLPGHDSRWIKPEPPALCPYRSPQAWAFLQIVILFTGLMAETLPQSLQRAARFPNFFLKPSSKKDWIEWGLSWLRQRDIDYITSKGDDHYDLRQSFCESTLTFSPVYDTMQALLSVKEDFTLRNSRDFALSMGSLYAVFDDFSEFRHGHTDQLTRYIHDVILDEPPLPVALPRELLRDCQLEAISHHTKLLFGFTAVTDLTGLSGSLSSQLLSCAIHMTNWTCRNLDMAITREGNHDLSISRIMEGRDCPISVVWHRHRSFGKLSRNEEEDTLFLDQLLDVLAQVFEHACINLVDHSGDTLGKSIYVKTLLHALSNIFSQREDQKEQMTRHDNILQTLNLRLPSQRSPYLFIMVSIYAHFLLEVSPHFELIYKRTVHFDRLIDTLDLCRHHFSEDAQTNNLQRSMFPESLHPGFTWAYVEADLPLNIVPPTRPASLFDPSSPLGDEGSISDRGPLFPSNQRKSLSELPSISIPRFSYIDGIEEEEPILNSPPPKHTIVDVLPDREDLKRRGT